jgi:hypothetical protein
VLLLRSVWNSHTRLLGKDRNQKQSMEKMEKKNCYPVFFLLNKKGKISSAFVV